MINSKFGFISRITHLNGIRNSHNSFIHNTFPPPPPPPPEFAFSGDKYDPYSKKSKFLPFALIGAALSIPMLLMTRRMLIEEDLKEDRRALRAEDLLAANFSVGNGFKPGSATTNAHYDHPLAQSLSNSERERRSGLKSTVPRTTHTSKQSPPPHSISSSPSTSSQDIPDQPKTVPNTLEKKRKNRIPPRPNPLKITISDNEIEQLKSSIDDIKKAHSVPESDLPLVEAHRKIIILGSGESANYARMALLKVDPEAELLMITSASVLPYKKLSLNKHMIRNRETVDSPEDLDWSMDPDSVKYQNQVASLLAFRSHGKSNKLLFLPSEMHYMYDSVKELRDVPAHNIPGKGWQMDVLMKHKVVDIDVENSIIYLKPLNYSQDEADDETRIHTIGYENLLICTGVSPDQLDPTISIDEDILPGVISKFTDFKDYCQLETYLTTFDSTLEEEEEEGNDPDDSPKAPLISLIENKRTPSVTVVNETFESIDLINSLQSRKVDLHLLQHTQDPYLKVKSELQHSLPEDFYQIIDKQIQDTGVDRKICHIDSIVTNPKFDNEKEPNQQDEKQLFVRFTDSTGNQGQIETDKIIFWPGSHPNSDFLKGSPIELDDQGYIVCNSQLQAHHNVWAAGDIASFYSAKLGKRIKGRHAALHTNAQNQGMFCAHQILFSQENHTSSQKFVYDHVPKRNLMFPPYKTPQGTLAGGNHLVFIGDVDSSLKTVSFITPMSDDFQEPSKRVGDSESVAVVEELESVAVMDLTNPLDQGLWSMGTVFYIDENDTVVGITLWNAPHFSSRAQLFLQSDPVFPQEKIEQLNSFFPIG